MTLVMRLTFYKIHLDQQCFWNYRDTRIFKSAISGAAVQAVGGNVTPSSIVARATGQIFNPNLELLSGVDLRSFPFEFRVLPKRC